MVVQAMLGRKATGIDGWALAELRKLSQEAIESFAVFSDEGGRGRGAPIGPQRGQDRVPLQGEGGDSDFLRGLVPSLPHITSLKIKAEESFRLISLYKNYGDWIHHLASGTIRFLTFLFTNHFDLRCK